MLVPRSCPAVDTLSPLAAAAIGAVALNRYTRHRKRTYRELAARREALHRHAPACLALYHSPELWHWLGRVVGETLQPTADHDQTHP
jgi:hypothetical protein